MSYLDLYMNHNPLITSPSEDRDVSVIVYGIPFDSTHSFRPGTRFGPDAIRHAFNNIEIFSTRFNVDLEKIIPFMKNKIKAYDNLESQQIIV
ncbi:MAG: arginase family protein [Nitrosotalea sp.]